MDSKKSDVQSVSQNPKDELNESVSIDEFFDRVNQSTLSLQVKPQEKIETVKNSENLIVFENTPLTFDKLETKMEVIQEEPEVDEHSLLMNRLMNGNTMQRTAITNFVNKK